jgi:hypothetical protein
MSEGAAVARAAEVTVAGETEGEARAVGERRAAVMAVCRSSGLSSP